MGSSHRTAFTFAALAALSSTAFADPLPPPELPADTATGMTQPSAPVGDGAKEPGRGDFDAGGVVRFPSGPDEMGQYASFEWIALDAVGRYFLLDSVTISGSLPLAVKKPEMIAGADPRLIGGGSVTLEAKLPKLPAFESLLRGTELGISLTGAYMREGAMLLSAKDFPLYVGDFQPGFASGVLARVKLSSLLDVSTAPRFVYQSGSDESLTAVQIPLSVIVKLGSLLKVSAEAGVFTGDDYSFAGDNGGRIAAGGSVTVKLGPIVAHAGAGVASLLTGGLYPAIGDSLYVDLNVSYAK
jgi:hypothetical protein